MSRITRPRRTAGLLAAVALSAAAVPSAASADLVSAGHLDWTQYAVYDVMAAPNADKTWLGYVTSGAPVNAQGTATPIAPATGDTVTPASPRGATEDYTTVFPVSPASAYNPAEGTGTFEFDGGLDFQSANHAFDITVVQPKVVLDGLSGKLYASGKGSTADYDRTAPLFNLDLTDATVTLKADGSRVLSGIVPSLATAETAFPSTYAVGSGPTRTPNIYGTFALTIKTQPGDVGPPPTNGKDGATGPAGPAGPTGPTGKNGTSATIRSVKAVLAKAPFKGVATRKVGVYNSKGKKVASGTVKGRVLKVTLADKVTSLSGKVKLKVTGSTSSATVRIPS